MNTIMLPTGIKAPDFEFYATVDRWVRLSDGENLMVIGGAANSIPGIQLVSDRRLDKIKQMEFHLENRLKNLI